MKQTSTHLIDSTLFSFEESSVDFLDIKLENQACYSVEQQTALTEIDTLDSKLMQHFHNKIKVQPALTRQLVGFQANKPMSTYRWYKYKEAFSASLIEILLSKYGIASGKVLDPFAGSGTALFAASGAGIDADGIELLPVGQQIILARECLDKEFTKDDFNSLKRWGTERPWCQSKVRIPLSELRITAGAYPKQTFELIEQYMGAWQRENDRVQSVLRFALLCVLESISGKYSCFTERKRQQQPADGETWSRPTKKVCLCLEEVIVVKNKPHRKHLSGSSDLVTTYEEIRAGFVSLALEKNRRATSFVEQARSLKAVASQAKTPADLLIIESIQPALLTASGYREKYRFVPS